MRPYKKQNSILIECYLVVVVVIVVIVKVKLITKT